MRLIDADELIPLIKMGECNMYDEYCQGRNGGIDFSVERIKQMPTIEPQRWVPVSERLPNCNGCYLVWRPHFFGGEIGMPSICYFDGSDTWHDSYGVDFERILHSDDVVAWMPLPEPYRGET